MSFNIKFKFTPGDLVSTYAGVAGEVSCCIAYPMAKDGDICYLVKIGGTLVEWPEQTLTLVKG